MADTPISAFTLAGELQGDEFISILQRAGGGAYDNFRLALSDILGSKGDTGDTGKSAYDVAVEDGFTGTRTEWLNSLTGADAYQVYLENTTDDPVLSETEWLSTLVGQDAYEVAVEDGFEGTREEWLESLKAETPYQIAVRQGFEGTETEWLDSLKGDRGDSAYQVYVETTTDSPVMSKEAWLESLEGTAGPGLQILGSFEDTVLLPSTGSTPGDAYIIDFVMWVWEGAKWEPVGQVGPTGKSAYQIAIENGFSGSQAEWIESLEGSSAYRVAVDEGFSGSAADWLESLKGKDAYQIYVDSTSDDPVLTKLEWLDSLVGNDAYDVAVEDGFVGTRAEWLDSLVGPQGDQGVKGDQGEQGDPSAAITVMGKVADVDSLPTDATAGDGYFIGQELHVWDSEAWINCGEVVGPQGEKGLKGDKGDTGDKGDSAYTIALADGYSGTQSEWLESLKGKSAYQIAVDLDYDGTESEWLETLVGPEGTSAYQTAVNNGFSGTESEWVASLKGNPGLTAYEVAVNEGYSGSRAEWLETLKGEKGNTGDQGVPGQDLQIDGVVSSEGELPGSPGAYMAYLVGMDLYLYLNETWENAGQLAGPSAYQLAVDNGYGGTETEWLDSLVGKSAYQIAVDDGFSGSEGQWLETLVGDSAFEVAQAEGFTGTRGEWLASLIGPKGDTGDTGDKGDTGDPGPSLNITDQVATEGDLPTTGTVGEGYLVGQDLYAWVSDAWKNLGSVKGPQGIQGDTGERGGDGKSAYDLAVENGFEGTQSEWITSLEGKSAYEVAVETGFVGTEAEWVATLKGPQGLSAYDVAVEEGFSGDKAAWLSSLMGAQGESAYELAVADGFSGTRSAWLESLVGGRGMSAFEVAQDSGFTGTREEWLTSLIGPAGDSAYQVYVDTTSDDPVLTKAAWLESLVGPKGKDAVGVDIQGTLTSVDDLPTSDNYQGKAYIIGGDVHMYVDDTGEWENLGPIQGADGKNAYELAVDSGYSGTRAEWLASLEAANPYELAVEDGFAGTREEWLDSLIGASAFDIAVEDGFEGTREEWLTSLNGNRWIVMAQDPNSVTGRVGDLFFNTSSQEAFQKTNETQWSSLGNIGGGSVYEAPTDGADYVRKNGEWVLLKAEVPEAPEDGQQYVRQSAGWAVLKAEVPEAPEDDQDYVRRNAGWSALTAADATTVKTGGNNTGKVTTAVLAALFEEMNIYYDNDLADWVLDENPPATSG